MFTKLLKHELKSQGGVIGILSLAALGAGVIGSLMLTLLKNIITEGVNETAAAMGTAFSFLVLMGVILAIFAYSVGIWIMQIARFYKRHFSDEGYLTFTLPANSHQILLSSLVNIAIWSVVSYFVIMVSISIIILPVREDIFYDLNIFEFYNSLYANLYGVDTPLLQLFNNLSSALYSLILAPLAITIGAQITKKHKLLAAFGIYYGLNMATSIITGVSSVFLVISDPYTDGSLTLMLSSVINSVLYLGIAIGGYFLMHHLVDKKLNLP